MATTESGPKDPAAAFDAAAEAFDAWFAKNANVFESELLAEKQFLSDPENTLSIGCGTGLFEERLGIRRGVEPAEGMARLARKRGIDVRIAPAENVPYENESFNGVLLGTILSYVKDRRKAMSEALRVLKRGGHIVVSNLPKEGSYAMLYDLAAIRGKYDPETAPEHPYPLEFIEAGTWVSTGEVVELMKNAGFVGLEYLQTLTRHPKYTNDSVERPVPGYDKGDYVVIRARKP
jgi:SAM-dependent methyltransferase